MLRRLFLSLIFVSATLVFAQEPATQPTLTPQQSGTTELLISVSAVNSNVVWASGTGGTFVVTTDGGKHWKAWRGAGSRAFAVPRRSGRQR